MRRLCRNFYTLAIVSFISGLISVYDNVMNVVFFEDLPRNEQNPVASLVIERMGVEGLVEIKAWGTIIAVVLMLLLTKTKYKMAIWGVFTFQFFLFCYLTFYASSGGYWEDDLFIPVKFFFDFYLG